MRRDLSGLARGRFVWAARAVTALAAAALALLAARDLGDRTASHAVVGATLFRITLVVQVVIALAMSPLFAASRVAWDRVQGLADLLALTELRTAPTAGRIVGAWLVTASVCLGAAPVQMVATGFGGVTLEDLGRAALVLSVLSFLGAAVGVLAGELPWPPLPCLAFLTAALVFFHEGLPALASSTAAPPFLPDLHSWSTLAWAVDGTGPPSAALQLGAVAALCALGAAWLEERRRGVAPLAAPLSRDARRRVGIALLICSYELVPAVLLQIWHDRMISMAVAELLLRVDLLLAILLPAVVAAAVIGGERARGTLSLLLLTGAGPARILRRAWRRGLVTGVLATVALALHQLLFRVTATLEEWGGLLSLGLPLEALTSGILLCGICIPAAVIGRSALSSVALALGATLAASLVMPLLFVVSPNVGLEDPELLSLSPLCVVLSPGTSATPLLLPLVPIVAMLGLTLLEPLHRRFS